MNYFGFTETLRFVKRAEILLGSDVISALQLYLCKYPEDGVIVPAANGIRKLRWAASDRGKRGGARIIYYYAISADRILLLDVYAKNEKEDLSAEDLRQLKNVVDFWRNEIENPGETK